MRFHKGWPNVLSNIETFPQPSYFRSKFRFLRLSTARKLILYLGGFPPPPVKTHPTPVSKRDDVSSTVQLHQLLTTQGDALVSVSVVWYQCVIRDLMKLYGRWNVSWKTATLLQHRVLDHGVQEISRSIALAILLPSLLFPFLFFVEIARGSRFPSSFRIFIHPLREFSTKFLRRNRVSYRISYAGVDRSSKDRYSIVQSSYYSIVVT